MGQRTHARQVDGSHCEGGKTIDSCSCRTASAWWPLAEMWEIADLVHSHTDLRNLIVFALLPAWNPRQQLTTDWIRQKELISQNKTISYKFQARSHINHKGKKTFCVVFLRKQHTRRLSLPATKSRQDFGTSFYSFLYISNWKPFWTFPAILPRPC
jgi:hypothetical protein